MPTFEGQAGNLRLLVSWVNNAWLPATKADAHRILDYLEREHGSATQRVAELEAKVTRLQSALREQDKWWWESVGEGQAAESDEQLTERWGLYPGDLDQVKGEGDGDTRTTAERIADTTIAERRAGH